MIITPKAFEEFKQALYGGRGDFDAWLECMNEEECRAFINMLVRQSTQEVQTED